MLKSTKFMLWHSLFSGLFILVNWIVFQTSSWLCAYFTPCSLLLWLEVKEELGRRKERGQAVHDSSSIWKAVKLKCTGARHLSEWLGAGIVTGIFVRIVT